MTRPSKERATGLRSTRQRAAILDALRNASGFKTAQRLHQELLRAGEQVGLATVYRNLQALVGSGEVDVLQNESGEAMFRLCSATDHHHHLVCRGCGHSEELTAEEVESWATRVARRHGFDDVTHTAEVFGLCGDCAR
ncbi:MAG TPA: Fur family transcriptional regulator [Actinomycetota bacterium]|nr:Fur family transcriptional regulator [Actinomycetota bacterium]